MALIGYARVSTGEQDTGLQLDALAKAGVSVVFSEKTSSVGRRPELQRALAALGPGSVLVVWKLDRIARSLGDLLGILARLKSAGVGLRSLTEPIDTSTPMGEFVIQILGAVAQLERAMIRERTIAGQLAAFARGVQLGRRPTDVAREQLVEVRELYATGQFSYPDLAAFYGVHPSTVKRWVTGRRSRPRMKVLGAYLSHASAQPT